MKITIELKSKDLRRARRALIDSSGTVLETLARTVIPETWGQPGLDHEGLAKDLGAWVRGFQAGSPSERDDEGLRPNSVHPGDDPAAYSTEWMLQHPPGAPSTRQVAAALTTPEDEERLTAMMLLDTALIEDVETFFRTTNLRPASFERYIQAEDGQRRPFTFVAFCAVRAWFEQMVRSLNVVGVAYLSDREEKRALIEATFPDATTIHEYGVPSQSLLALSRTIANAATQITTAATMHQRADMATEQPVIDALLPRMIALRQVCETFFAPAFEVES